MIHIELFFLISAVSCATVSNCLDNSNKNNQPLVVDRSGYDIIRNSATHDHFMFTTISGPNFTKNLPTLGNGHLGFTVLSDAVYMNGLYNGYKGLSHRAKIPNFVNILLADCLIKICKYSLNIELGYFEVKFVVEKQFIVRHLIYAHRFYNRALINQIHIQRLESKDDINLKLHKNPGNDEALTKVKTAQRSRNERSVNDVKSNNFSNNKTKNVNNKNSRSTLNAVEKDDLEFTKNETIDFDGIRLYMLCGRIRELENGGNERNEYNEDEISGEEPPRQEEDVCVLWNHVPEEITLYQTLSSISYKFVMAVDTQAADVRQEMMDVFRISDDELFESHKNVWKKFWKDFQIDVDGDDELLRAITSSIFYLTSSLPSVITNLPQHPFYGLSPTGLGRGGSNLNDYEGHNFWDTEMFMLPPVALINPNWAKKLIEYRFMMLNAAKNNANAGGYRGARFPWESAATGIEVIQPGYEYIAEYQQHISGDISFSLRHYFSLTHDIEFMMSEGCQLALNIAEFWASRVTFNDSTGFYDINHVMGPDEDHSDVNNNVYTNVVAKYALEFGLFSKYLCGKQSPDVDLLQMMSKIKIIYDDLLDYHPQYEGYKIGTEIKQADAILIGYPLMFPMNYSTRVNDLKFYENVTRSSGPAMSYSMTAINFLDINDEVKANEMLLKGYKTFIRRPFNVWSEVEPGEIGATNFITGAGGFLQTIFNGFLGIRVHLDHFEIRNPRLPQNCTRLRVEGFSYMKSKFEIEVSGHSKSLRFVEVNDKLILESHDDETKLVTVNVSYDITNNIVTNIKPAYDPFNDFIHLNTV